MALGNKKRRASSVFFVFLIAIFLLFGIFSRMIDSRLSLTEIPDSAKAATPFFQVVVLEMKDTALPSTVSGLKTLRASVYSSIDDTHLSSLNFYL